MDDQLLLHLYHHLFDPARLRVPKRGRYSDQLIVLIFFLSVIRDRSRRWACVKKNWPLWMRRLPRPSYTQFNRRLKSRTVLRLIARLYLEFRDRLPHSDRKIIDGKPLAVGGFSKDPDTRRGRLPGGGWGRGYKLHLLIDALGPVEMFRVTPLDGGEPTALRAVLPFSDVDRATILGDSNYDSNPLHADVAAGGGTLVAPRKKPGRGLGCRPHHPNRLAAIRQLEASEQAREDHERERLAIEQRLGHLTNAPFSLYALPNFVRRKSRVTLWILAKITLYHLYCAVMTDKHLAA